MIGDSALIWEFLSGTRVLVAILCIAAYLIFLFWGHELKKEVKQKVKKFLKEVVKKFDLLTKWTRIQVFTRKYFFIIYIIGYIAFIWLLWRNRSSGLVLSVTVILGIFFVGGKIIEDNAKKKGERLLSQRITELEELINKDEKELGYKIITKDLKYEFCKTGVLKYEVIEKIIAINDRVSRIETKIGWTGGGMTKPFSVLILNDQGSTIKKLDLEKDVVHRKDNTNIFDIGYLKKGASLTIKITWELDNKALKTKPEFTFMVFKNRIHFNKETRHTLKIIMPKEFLKSKNQPKYKMFKAPATNPARLIRYIMDGNYEKLKYKEKKFVMYNNVAKTDGLLYTPNNKNDFLRIEGYHLYGILWEWAGNIKGTMNTET